MRRTARCYEHFMRRFSKLCANCAWRTSFLTTELLALYNLIQHRISFMMYKLVNGLLPEVMNELYTTNDQIHCGAAIQHLR